MAMKRYNQIAGQSVFRITSLSDGVFAIALTLLVLDIRVPVQATVRDQSGLIDAFLSLTPKLLTYFLSFMTLGIFWTGQSAQFHYIKKSDRNLNWITLFFLLFVSVLPFTTAFLGEYIEYPFAVLIYWLNIFLPGIMLLLNWRYAYRKEFTSIEGDELESVNQAISKRIVVAQSLYAAGAAISFLNTYLSIAAIIAIQLQYALAIFSFRIKRRNKTRHR
jgi:uncharacterized membrane protein